MMYPSSSSEKEGSSRFYLDIKAFFSAKVMSAMHGGNAGGRREKPEERERKDFGTVFHADVTYWTID